MILNNATNAKSFVYCSVYQSPNETTNYYNSGNGHFHESIYIIEGTAEYTTSTTAELSGNETYLPLTAGQLYDITNTQGQYVITKTDVNGASMMMFNPIPEDKQLNVKIVNGPNTVTVESADVRTTVVCVTGPVTIKDKTLNSLQYAVVFANTSADLILPENTICALVVG
jgi:hypothetical protein